MPAQPLSVLVVQVVEVGHQQPVSQDPQIQRVDQPQQPTGVPSPLVQRRRWPSPPLTRPGAVGAAWPARDRRVILGHNASTRWRSTWASSPSVMVDHCGSGSREPTTAIVDTTRVRNPGSGASASPPLPPTNVRQWSSGRLRRRGDRDGRRRGPQGVGPEPRAAPGRHCLHQRPSLHHLSCRWALTPRSRLWSP